MCSPLSRLIPVAVIALGIAGCTSGIVVNENRDPLLVMVSSGTGIRYNRDIRVVTANLSGTPAVLWPQLKAAFSALGLPVTASAGADHALSAQNAEFNGTFDKAPMSRVVNCGLTSMGAQRANAYRVWLTVASQLQAADTGSTLRTTVVATAQDPSSSTASVQCGSTGMLEEELAKRMGGQK